MENLFRDFWYGLRMIRNNPGFSAIAVLTLAIGIGANTAIFSLVNSALLKPAPGERPDQLVGIFFGDAQGHGLSNHSYPDYVEYRKRSSEILTGLAAYTTLPASLISAQGSGRINVGLVSDNYFSVCGLEPTAGRTFLPEDNITPGAHFTAIISEGLWRERFGSSHDLTGKTIRLNESNYSVVGVVPEKFSRMAEIVKIDVFVPAVMEGVIGGDRDFLSKRQNKEFMVVGRRRAGVPTAQVQARFNLIASELQHEYPGDWTENGHTRPLSVVPYSSVPFELRGLVVGLAGLLLGGVAVVLLVACNNLANFLLARGVLRKSEVVVRLALGASRWRIVQQLLVENLTLSALGGCCGLLVALWLKGLLTRFSPNVGVPIVIDLSVDYRVLLFNASITICTALAFGLGPAIHAIKNETSEALKEVNQTPNRQGKRFRSILVVTQMAFSLVLLMCAGIFLSGVMKLRAMDLGFNANNLALVSVNPMLQGYSAANTRQFLQQATDRLKALPGVQSIAVATRVPMGLSSVREQISAYEPDVSKKTGLWVGSNHVNESYFQTMQVPIVRGRGFGREDTNAGAPVAIINTALATKLWPNQDAIGKSIRQDTTTREIVGVVRTGKYDSLAEDPLPFLYVPLEQAASYNTDLTFHIRTTSSPAILLPEFRRQLLALNPALTVFDLESMEEHLAQSVLPIRMAALLLSIFGTLAIALASIGLYGITAYLVRQRTREMGIRMALGASRSDALKLVIKQSMKLVAIGITIGLGVGAAITVLIAGQLYGIGSEDLATLSIIVSVQCGIALFACWAGSRPVMRLDPAIALRCQ